MREMQARLSGTDWPKQLSMKPQEYRAHVEQLGMTISSARHLFGMGERSTRRFAAGDATVPLAIELLLRIMVERKISPELALGLAGRKPPRQGFADRRRRDDE